MIKRCSLHYTDCNIRLSKLSTLEFHDDISVSSRVIELTKHARARTISPSLYNRYTGGINLVMCMGDTKADYWNKIYWQILKCNSFHGRIVYSDRHGAKHHDFRNSRAYDLRSCDIIIIYTILIS